MKLEKDKKNLEADLSKIEEDSLKALDLHELEALTATRAANNLQREKDLRDIAEKDANRERRGKKIRRWITLGIMVVIILMLLVRCNRNELPEWIDTIVTVDKADTVDTDTLASTPPVSWMRDPAETHFNFGLNVSPVFQNGLSEGDLMITNEKDNRYNMYCELFLGDDVEAIFDRSKLLYASGMIETGRTIPKIKLDVNLPAGEYVCRMAIYGVDKVTSALVTTGSATVHLTVLETVESPVENSAAPTT
ncbi:MAG: hypothetical protein RR313_00080 [Anaerovoracaceae bacterium]